MIMPFCFRAKRRPYCTVCVFSRQACRKAQKCFRTSVVYAQIRLLGRWEELEDFSGKTVPVGGLAYYITPPASLSNVFTDPFHSVFYVTFILMSCAIFSKAWMDVSGSSSLVRDGGMVLPAAVSGRRRPGRGDIPAVLGGELAPARNVHVCCTGLDCCAHVLLAECVWS